VTRFRDFIRRRRREQLEGKGGGGGKIGFQAAFRNGANGEVVYDALGKIRAEVGKVEGSGSLGGSRVIGREGCIRIVPGCKYSIGFDINFETVQIGSRIERRAVRVRYRRFPT